MIKPTRMTWVGHVAHMGAKRNAYRVFVETPKGTMPLGRRRSRWEDIIKMDLKGIG
jgi:hypothetical protein